MALGENIRAYQAKTGAIAMGQCIVFPCPQAQSKENLLCEIHLKQIADSWKTVFRRTAAWEYMREQAEGMMKQNQKGA